ncbi:uncharacterized protein LOC119453745 [Dermacentor silvarum]|uniref:uncharacterized protein LOC119453745 n=1 Tax=Dermacentor silvarum TaxID=543639 RepID=UPI00189C1E24|nr:uncharacterized protein LOC119453745 [Dermacentor silvarum]
MEPATWTRFVIWTALCACSILRTALCQQQECDPVPVLRCYGGVLSSIETDMDRLVAKYGPELDAALRTFAGKYPASSSPCKIRPGEQGRCTAAEREQLERIEGVYEVFQRTVSDSDALKDMVEAYKCWDRRKYRDCFASLLQDTLIREYRDSSNQYTPAKTRICRQWSALANSCFDDTTGALCPDSARAGRQHFRDVMAAYVGSFGCPDSGATAGKPLLLTSTAIAFTVWLMTRLGAFY